jgi:hypothetical protein
VGRLAASSWTPWVGWALVVAWALAAFALFSRGPLLRRLAVAIVLAFAGLVAYFG